MELDKITLLSVVKKRLNWLSQRQEVLAQNIANADTPNYKPSDLRPYNFAEMVRAERTQLNLNVSEPGHISGDRKRLRDFSMVTERRPFETAPNGNAVILEEQMAKIGETQFNHSFMTEIYKKHLRMLKMAIGNR
ncbi:MAG: flagellar basal body rod protein FlgB [Rhodospirillaceae bacterium]|nr:flagellar basal body rod protein FlgB [Rhodospirillaceae bacterium]